MNRKRIMISVILLCMVLLSSCFDYEGYPKYRIKELENEQYTLTSPDGITYVTLEEHIWYPREVMWMGQDGYEPIGKCKLGYVFETSSELCVCVNELALSPSIHFFLEGTELPGLSIESINNAVLISSGREDQEINIDLQTAEMLAELYNDTKAHEIKSMHGMERIWGLVIECEQLDEYYFWRPIYKYGNDYYLYIPSRYDSRGEEAVHVFCKCTSVIEDILSDN